MLTRCQSRQLLKGRRAHRDENFGAAGGWSHTFSYGMRRLILGTAVIGGVAFATVPVVSASDFNPVRNLTTWYTDRTPIDIEIVSSPDPTTGADKFRFQKNAADFVLSEPLSRCCSRVGPHLFTSDWTWRPASPVPVSPPPLTMVDPGRAFLMCQRFHRKSASRGYLI